MSKKRRAGEIGCKLALCKILVSTVDAEHSPLLRRVKPNNTNSVLVYRQLKSTGTRSGALQTRQTSFARRGNAAFFGCTNKRFRTRRRRTEPGFRSSAGGSGAPFAGVRKTSQPFARQCAAERTVENATLGLCSINRSHFCGCALATRSFLRPQYRKPHFLSLTPKLYCLGVTQLFCPHCLNFTAKRCPKLYCQMRS